MLRQKIRSVLSSIETCFTATSLKLGQVCTCLITSTTLLTSLSTNAEVEYKSQELSGEPTIEYLQVLFEPSNEITHAGDCALKDGLDQSLEPGDISVLIEGVCYGWVGDLMQLTSGSIEISVDVVGASVEVLELRDTTLSNPKIITIQIMSLN